MRIFILYMAALFVYFPVRRALFGEGSVFGDSYDWFFSDIICLTLIWAAVVGIQFFRFPARTFGRVFEFWQILSMEGDSRDVHKYLASSAVLTMVVSMLLSGVVLVCEHQGLLMWTHVRQPAFFVICCGILTAVLYFVIPLYELRRQIRKDSVTR